MNALAIEVALGLLSSGAVFLRPNDPFTWASGIKSPIYCDNRLILTAPETRLLVEKGLSRLIDNVYPSTELLMGTSTAGIAHAAITAHMKNLPMGYVRSSNKDHGRANRIEGKLLPGQKTVVVEDLISTAGSAIETAEALREAGADVLGIVSIFTYNMRKALDNLASANLTCHSLCSLDILAEVAAKHNYISPDDMRRVLKFRDRPDDPSWRE